MGLTARRCSLEEWDNRRAYYLFGAWKDVQGGAADFLGAYKTQEEAEAEGLKRFADDNRLSSWCHIAVFDGTTMRIIRCLAIPGTEDYDFFNDNPDEEEDWDGKGGILKWVAHPSER